MQLRRHLFCLWYAGLGQLSAFAGVGVGGPAVTCHANSGLAIFSRDYLVRWAFVLLACPVKRGALLDHGQEHS